MITVSPAKMEDRVFYHVPRDFHLHPVVDQAILDHLPPEDIFALATEFNKCPDHTSDDSESACQGRQRYTDSAPVPHSFLLQHSMLCKAIKERHRDLVDALFRRGYNIHSEFAERVEDCPFILACQLGHIEILDMFWVQNPRLMSRSYYAYRRPNEQPTLELMAHDDPALLQAALPFWPSVSPECPLPPLHTAVVKGAHKCAEYILHANLEEANARDANGLTPLMHCTSANLVQLLLDSGAQVNAVHTRRGDNCLHFLFQQDLPKDAREICLLLIKNGIKINAKNNFQHTPVYTLFVQCGSIFSPLKMGSAECQRHRMKSARECLELLLYSGAKLNPINEKHFIRPEAPLFVAVDNFIHALDVLAGFNSLATPDMHNIGSYSPLIEDSRPREEDLRCFVQFTCDLMEILLKHGAKSDLGTDLEQMPLEKIINFLLAIRYHDESSHDRIWPFIQSITLMLLQHGARKCNLVESLLHLRCSHKLELVTMILNSLPHIDYIEELAKINKALDSYNTEEPPDQTHELQIEILRMLVKKLYGKPRSLKASARWIICDMTGIPLNKKVNFLPLPDLLREYVKSFTD